MYKPKTSESWFLVCLVSLMYDISFKVLSFSIGDDMRVYLKRNKLDTERTLPKSVSQDVFKYVLLKLGVPEDRLSKICIRLEFLNMIPAGGMVVINTNRFLIALRQNLLDNYGEMQRVVAHELKHIAVEILKPHKLRTDGKKKWPYKWEEVNCARAEKRWGGFEYFRRA